MIAEDEGNLLEAVGEAAITAVAVLALVAVFAPKTAAAAAGGALAAVGGLLLRLGFGGS